LASATGICAVNYYNEIDPKAAAWLRELIKQGFISRGEVDERSIEEVTPNDLRGFVQCHFFAGIGVWSHALRLAGWPDDKPVWTGSCPCQPFSAAGKRKGVADSRHLWPAWHWLIRKSKPSVVFGEQVASKDGISWLDTVSNDMEKENYAIGPIVLPACSVGSPHIRQRLWFAAKSLNLMEYTESDRRIERRPESSGRSIVGGCGESALANADGGNSGAKRKQRSGKHGFFAENGRAGELANATGAIGERLRTEPDGKQSRPSNGGGLGHASGEGSFSGPQSGIHSGEETGGPRDGKSQRSSAIDEMGDSSGEGSPGRSSEPKNNGKKLAPPQRASGPTNGFWANAEWLECTDGKARPIKPGTSPLAHGVANRVAKLRGIGNAIVAQAAAEVIGAYMDWENQS
jgi:DNA (cytosine-5)-methyltransferase 1